jgi:hypothetical protein
MQSDKGASDRASTDQRWKKFREKLRKTNRTSLSQRNMSASSSAADASQRISKPQHRQKNLFGKFVEAKQQQEPTITTQQEQQPARKRPDYVYDANGNIQVLATDPLKEIVKPLADKRCKPVVVALQRTKRDGIVQGGLYVGRRFAMGGWSLPASRFANVFNNKEGTAPEFRVSSHEELVTKYRQRVLSDPALRAQLPNLLGQRLACWCEGKKGKDGSKCHARILADLVEDVCIKKLQL